ncbi:hypothetical protein BJ944DRAFT_289363 [Cunninghamella echinulata]|nr:hypothetical protein BJ944DRAFT_289363 [Cunninghamella echinulata]
MGKKHNKSKAKKKNNNNNNNNNKKTQNKSNEVEPVTQQQLITDVILDSNSLIIKNDSAITTTDTFSELEQDIAKLEETKAKKDAIIKATIDSVVASHILDTTCIVEKNNNISEYVKNNKEETKQNNVINQQSPLLPPQNNKIIKAAIDSVITSHCIDLDSIIKKNNKKITENVKINKESGVTTETNHNSNQQSIILLSSPIKAAIDSVVASHTLDLGSIIEKNNNNNNNEEKNAQKINPITLSPKKNPIIMATIQSAIASHSLDLESILTNINKEQSSNIKKEEKIDQQVLDSTITTTNSLENNSIIKSTIDSVVASHNLDALSIVQNNKNIMTTSTQQPILEEKMKKKMAASPTGSTSSIRSSNSQHIINSTFLGKPSPTSKTDDTIAKGGILSMPEPAMTSAGLKGKAPLDKRFSTISISKLLPPTPVKGLPEIPSSDEEDNNKYATASSKNNNTARSPARIDSFEAPVPISKDKHSSKTKRSSLLFDKKNKSKCTIQ